MISCQSKPYEKTHNGIIVNIKGDKSGDASKIRLQVYGDKLIRVSATPEKKFSNRESLIISGTPGNYDFSVQETEQDIILSTKSIKAIVAKNTGEVKFTDLNDKIILSENTDGGKTFQPITVDGTKQYSVRQVFNSDDDEAFFGLGQHQSDEFNYKGKNEELFQYNTKVTVPFIV